ncbi:DUF4190 domain-containing protein [Streptomyces collinus]|uniref:DUF4190 domain-containing protein n=1 Tax=Streptomyces collinus TaxID=42684 RepID=UPI003790E472
MGLSSTNDARTAAGEPAPALTRQNRAAKASAFFALGGVAFLANFATGIAWINPGIFVGAAVLCALIAVPTGHVGRFRGRRMDGEGHGLALAGILTGWLVLFVCLLALLAFAGLVAGLAVLTEHS